MPQSDPQQPTNGWNEWSKHVLKELERLNDNYEGLGEKIGRVQLDITELKAGRSAVDDLKEWKKSMDEVTSPTLIHEMKKDIDDLKSFKARSVTIFAGVQLLITVGLAILALIF